MSVDRVVVVGASGNIGTSVVEALSRDPEVGSVLALCRRPPDLALPKVTWEHADITADDLTPRLRGAGAVVHLAWLFQPTHKPRATWANNVEGGIRVFRATADAG